MKIVYTNPMNGRAGTYGSIHYAVKELFDPMFADGELERVKEKSQTQSEFIGMLTEILVDKKILNKEDVEKLFGFNYRIEE